MSGCAFDDSFDSSFEICAPVVVASGTKGRHPQLISIATGKPIDLLAITDEELVETQILVAGSTYATAVTHPAAVLVERSAAGATVAEARTHRASVLVDRVGAGVTVATLRSVAAVGVLNDDLEVLYLAGVL